MCSLAYAPFNPNDNDNDISKPIEKKKSSKSKTLKRENNNRNVKNIMEEIHNNKSESNDFSDNGMSDFTPPMNPQSAAIERKNSQDVHLVNDNNNEDNNNEDNNDEKHDEPLNTPEAFNNIRSEQAQDYYRANVPYYTQMSQSPISNKDELMKKLEKILLLLEEQQDEKTGHVTEELILYSFLGVFIIFVVDSFARAGKYVR